ncbi:hypothetical protein QKT49_gp332 [Acanthamoeba castellanii medusavirus]|uniref:Uncharacterized protein n=1 Tax=Acanthamoeba castellanii medusavirus J1 TaxID=3114988 RepID=A0A3T1CX90_9VIRU|nr:hypothetical protein QKT49_gp332 [Acanthamoeba castellanii medusavirus]BBI30431.1 hypothetical protein [Acanthamoeba castellanii medusavirus J1]
MEEEQQRANNSTKRTVLHMRMKKKKSIKIHRLQNKVRSLERRNALLMAAAEQSRRDAQEATERVQRMYNDCVSSMEDIRQAHRDMQAVIGAACKLWAGGVR